MPQRPSSLCKRTKRSGEAEPCPGTGPGCWSGGPQGLQPKAGRGGPTQGALAICENQHLGQVEKGLGPAHRTRPGRTGKPLPRADTSGPDSTHVDSVSSPARAEGKPVVAASHPRRSLESAQRDEEQGRGTRCPKEEQEATCPRPRAGHTRAWLMTKGPLAVEAPSRES